MKPANTSAPGQYLVASAWVHHGDTHVPLTGGPQRVLHAVPATRRSDYFAGLLFKALGSGRGQAGCGRCVRHVVFALVDRKDQDNQRVVLDAVDKPHALLEELDFVAASQRAVEGAAGDMRTVEPLREGLLQVDAYRAVELVPFLEGLGHEVQPVFGLDLALRGRQGRPPRPVTCPPAG